MSYNGWTNYETWAVNLWLENEVASYDELRDLANRAWSNASGDSIEDRKKVAAYDIADSIKNWLGELNPFADKASLWSDLLSSALSEVDYDEIATNLLAEVASDD